MISLPSDILLFRLCPSAAIIFARDTIPRDAWMEEKTTVKAHTKRKFETIIEFSDAMHRAYRNKLHIKAVVYIISIAQAPYVDGDSSSTLRWHVIDFLT